MSKLRLNLDALFVESFGPGEPTTPGDPNPGDPTTDEPGVAIPVTHDRSCLLSCPGFC